LSIFEETGGGLAAVAHDRSLELFFDRFEVIARFMTVLNEDPAPRRVLYLHGMGGNGKSLLLRYLAARCCVRLPPDEWERVRRLPGAELPAALTGVGKAARVPVARIDFGARPVTHADRARSAIESGGYRVLYRLFPDQAVPSAAQIRAGLLMFAAGDALGVPWEGRTPGEIDRHCRV
jgi:hypothetical protein